MEKNYPKKNLAIDGVKYSAMWRRGNRNVPIFKISSMNGLNQFIGYVMFNNNSNGTVLYRGQCSLYPNMWSSGARPGSTAIPNSLIKSIAQSNKLRKLFSINRDSIVGWEKYGELVIEAILQHYGAKTYCMDFVDNHWCALWFGLYEFDTKSASYKKRTDKGETGKQNYLYLTLYLADTNGPVIQGLYIGEKTYTVNLRKALPSHFLRPTSQHGWIVRSKNRTAYDYRNDALAILKIKVSDADKWLGAGRLLSQENFFPSPSDDKGYRTLLSNQLRSGIHCDRTDYVLPQGTVQNYHTWQLYYHGSDISPTPAVTTYYKTNKGNLEQITSLQQLFALLLSAGWSKETSMVPSRWKESKPFFGQSAPTSLLVQKIFGGEIFKYNKGNKWYYFNRIDNINYELTSKEHEFTFSDYSKCIERGIGKGSFKEAEEKYTILIKSLNLVFKNK